MLVAQVVVVVVVVVIWLLLGRGVFEVVVGGQVVENELFLAVGDGRPFGVVETALTRLDCDLRPWTAIA